MRDIEDYMSFLQREEQTKGKEFKVMFFKLGTNKRWICHIWTPSFHFDFI